MPAVFSNFLATATAMAQVVASEPCGLIDAVDVTANIEGATLNTPINLGTVAPVTATAWSPSIITSLPSNPTDTGATLTLDQAREVRFDISGEQLNGLNVGNRLASTWLENKLMESMRTLRNEVEVFLALRAKQGASRAVGTAGTNPFATTMDATADLRQIFVDNGGPKTGWSLVVNPTAGTAARKLLGSVVAAAGSQAANLQIAGDLPVHNGFLIRESSGIALHTAGTLTGVTETPARTVGLTSFAIAGTTISLTPGDCFTIAGDTNVYVGQSTLAAGGTLNIGRPGLRVAGSGGAALTIGATYTPNIGIHRSAMVAVVRPPAQADIMSGGQPFLSGTITDPDNRFVYGMYVQQYDGGILISLRIIYGALVVNPFLVGILRGDPALVPRQPSRHRAGEGFGVDGRPHPPHRPTFREATMTIPTYIIKHKDHGEAIVDETTDLAAFEDAGWDVTAARKAIAAAAKKK